MDFHSLNVRNSSISSYNIKKNGKRLALSVNTSKKFTYVIIFHYFTVSRHYLDLKAVKASGFSYDSLVWGDGTVLDTSILLGNGTEEPVKNNEDVENMSMWGGKLDDIKEDEKASCLCQNT